MDHLTDSTNVYVPNAPHSSEDRMFHGGGSCGKMLSTIDWSTTPLGPVECWSPSLRIALRICLTSRHPILLWWGPDLIKLYNDAYAPLLGNKHPWALGQAGRDVWPEIWEVIGPMLGQVMASGDATWSDDQMLLLERNGYQEECYFTFSYSPIEHEDGQVGGVFTAVNETTTRVINERRTRLARDMAAAIAETDWPGASPLPGDGHSTSAICQRALDILATDAADLPCLLLYMIDETKQADGATPVATLCGQAGILPDTAWAPTSISPLSTVAVWPLAEAAQSHDPLVLTDLQSRIPNHAFTVDNGLIPHTAVILPLHEPGKPLATAILIAGISPRRPLDDDYLGFLDILGRHLIAAFVSAHAYEAERRRAEALAEIDRVKTAFFSNVSHEFRTPLTLMLGPLADLLERSGLDPDLREAVERIHRNGLRLLKLVNTLLDFSRIEAGRAQAHYVPTDLAALTADLASTFRSVIERAGLELVVDCPPLKSPVYVDHEMWEKTVLNLLSNAFKFTISGQIAISLHQMGDEAILEVRDTGIGIPADALPHIFDRFHRIQTAQARTHEGSGIGLALVRELVTLHGGAIAVTSVSDQGTAFRVSLPLGNTHLPPEQVGGAGLDTVTALAAAPYVAEAVSWGGVLATPAPTTSDTALAPAALESSLASAEAPTWPSTEQPVRSTTVLVVDDNADLRDYLCKLLRNQYQVLTASNGREALQVIEQTPPDLVLADVMMPEMDGFALLAALRAAPALSGIPMILLTAHADEGAAMEGLRAGANDYLVKPFSPRELLVRIAARLEIARARRLAEARARDLETVLNNIIDGVMMLDATGKIQHLNNSGRVLLGIADFDQHEYSQLNGADRGKLLRLRDLAGNRVEVEQTPQWRIIQGAVLAGSTTVDLRLTTIDGRERIFNIGGAPLYRSDGAIIGGILTFRDTTERQEFDQQTQSALRALLEMAEVLTLPLTAQFATTSPAIQQVMELIRQVLRGDKAAIAIFDPGGEMQLVASSGLTPRESAQIQHIAQGWNEADARSQAVLASLVAGQPIQLDTVHDLPTPNFDNFGVHTVMLVPALLANKRIAVFALGTQEARPYTPDQIALAQAVMQLFMLVQDRNRLLYEQAESRARELALQQSHQRMDEFLGIASHELRTPLTSIRANVQMAERGLRTLVQSTTIPELGPQFKPVPSLHHLLERTSRQLIRLDRLVGDLLDASRIQVDKLDLRMEVCDLVVIVEDAVAEQRMAWPDRELRVRTPERGTLLVFADPDRIGQVVTNLLTNALKYSASDQPVSVAIMRRGDQALLAVRDRGPGISVDARTRIFERFYRVPGIELRSGSGVGLGLGLFICATLIEQHHGQIGVESHVGRGSTFWFSLPLRH